MNSWEDKYRWYEYYYLNQNFPARNISLNDCRVSYTNNYDKDPIKPKDKAPMKNGWVTAKNGDRKHYLNDRLHNDNGPAIEAIDGSKTYYKNGKTHREDGPAYTSQGGTPSYYLNGELIYQYEFEARIEQRKKLQEKKSAAKAIPEVKPVAVNPYVSQGSKFWYKDPETKLHYHREDGPAIEYSSGTKEWWQHHKLHRLDGPAIETCEGGKYYCIEGTKYSNAEQYWKAVSLIPQIDNYGNTSYYTEGKKLHRENGPAYISKQGSKYWYVNGKRHRLDGPAFEDGNYKEFWIDDKIYFNVAHYWEAVSKIPQTSLGDTFYQLKGQFHREDGPAFIGKNGSKEWFKNGKRHRLDGPAIENVPGSHLPPYWIEGIGYQTKEAFEKKVIELQGPSAVSEVLTIVSYDANGTLTSFTTSLATYYKLDNDLHREDGPAVIYHDGSTQWYKKNQLHRLDGPALENANGYREWWVEGKKYSENEFNIMFKSKADAQVQDAPVTFLNKLQQNAKAAGPRILCKTISKGARAALIHLMKSKKMKKSWVRTVSEMMETEYGLAVVSFGLSLLFKYVPTLKDDPRAQYVADEFQIQSVETVGNELVEELMTFLLPAIMEYQEVRIEQPTNTRVESSVEEEEEDDSLDDSQIRKVA